MKKFLIVFVTLVVSVITHTQVYAQDSAFDDLNLNGMASYEALRKEYYIGALYLETLSQDPDSVLNMAGKKRMELRITIDKWSPRRFAQQWNQSILINNRQEDLNEFSEQILAFTNIPKEDLQANDQILIDLDPDVGTTVYLAKQKIFQTSSTAFFNLLLNTWIGQRPPSTDFKTSILILSTGQAATSLLTRYDSIKTTKAREQTITAWLKKEEEEKKAKVAASNDEAKSPSSIGPPGSGTKVTAKRVRESNSKKATKAAVSVAPAAVAAVAAAAATTVTKPTIDLVKPALNASGSADTKPEKAAAPVKKVEKPKPKPKPIVVAKKEEKPEKKGPSEQELAQKRLLNAYRSNVLKSTYMNTQYPKRAMDLKQEGLVVLKVVVDRKGKLVDIFPEVNSEHNLLNKAARNAVKKTQPFVPPPKGLKGSTVELKLHFNFKL